MKFQLIIALIAAVGLAGCGSEESRQAERDAQRNHQQILTDKKNKTEITKHEMTLEAEIQEAIEVARVQAANALKLAEIHAKQALEAAKVEAQKALELGKAKLARDNNLYHFLGILGIGVVATVATTICYFWTLRYRAGRYAEQQMTERYRDYLKTKALMGQSSPGAYANSNDRGPFDDLTPPPARLA